MKNPSSPVYPAALFHLRCNENFQNPIAIKSKKALHDLFKRLKIHWYEPSTQATNVMSAILTLSLRYNIETNILSAKFHNASGTLHVFPPAFPMKIIEIKPGHFDPHALETEAGKIRNRLRALRHEAAWELEHEGKRKQLLQKQIMAMLRRGFVNLSRQNEILIHKKTVDNFIPWLNGVARKWMLKEGQMQLSLSELQQKTRTPFGSFLSYPMYKLNHLDSSTQIKLPVTFVTAVATVLQESEFSLLFADYIGFAVLEQLRPYIAGLMPSASREKSRRFCIDTVG